MSRSTPSPRQQTRAPGFPRLLAHAGAAGRAPTLDEHLARFGDLGPGSVPSPRALIEAVTAAGLRGRGGGGFPTGLKLKAVAERRGRKVVVANGSEGEPASAKDRTLLRHAPHLILDGVALAAHAVGADTATVVVAEGDSPANDALAAALDERRRRAHDPVEITLAEIPHRFVSGEETSVVQWLNRGPALPTGTPPRPSERGVGGLPTLVQNVETLAQLALIARFGADWFREVGTPEEPGTALVTLLGAVARPGVREFAIGESLAKLIAGAGGTTEPAGAYLVGGYFGTWISAAAGDVTLADATLRAHGASLGARAIAVLPARRCGLVETARVARYLAGESAGQCGPCRLGLPAIADALDLLNTRGATAEVAARIERWCGEVTGRGACSHPDGAARFVSSALRVFEAEVALHQRGKCSGTDRRPLLPLPAEPGGRPR